MKVSDFQINCGVRSAFSRNWIDLSKVRFGSFRGTVRVSGELCSLGGHAAAVFNGAFLSRVESEIRNVRGVRQVFFELSNWRRSEAGEWMAIERPSCNVSHSDEGGQVKTYEMEARRERRLPEKSKEEAREAAHEH